MQRGIKFAAPQVAGYLTLAAFVNIRKRTYGSLQAPVLDSLLAEIKMALPSGVPKIHIIHFFFFTL